MSPRPTIIAAPLEPPVAQSSGVKDVTVEFVRALFGVLLLPVRVVVYLLQHKRRQAQLRRDLESPASIAELPLLKSAHRSRPLLIFIACAEASGEKHAANLVDALRQLEAERGAPAPAFIGLGGELLAERGVELIGDPVSRAAMGFDVFSNLPFYMRMLAKFSRTIQDRRPDLFLPVDSPALHVPLAHIAWRRHVPVVHFVTPQYWGWAPWRVGGYRRAVDLALTILPFEAPWFERERIPVAHVGHPLLDELEDIPRGQSDRTPTSSPIIALLPGSRRHVVTRNLPWMLRVLAEIQRENPALRVVIPQNDPALRPVIDGFLESANATAWARIGSGSLHDELAQARAAFSVSGTILIDLLHRRLPAVVLYRLKNSRQAALSKYILTCPYFSSVNLIAGREVLPEFCFSMNDPNEPFDEVVHAVTRSFSDGNWRAECLAGMDLAADRLGPSGAVQRAAQHALGQIEDEQVHG